MKQSPIAYAVVLLGLFVFGIWSVAEPFARDQGIHATIAFALREGLVTYSDVFNIKPPATTAVHWLSQVMFGHAESSIRWFDFVFVGATGCALLSLLVRWGFAQVPGVLTVLGFFAVYYAQTYWTKSQTDGWAGFLLVFGLLCMTIGWDRGRAVWFLVAGVLLSLSFALKYTIAPIALAIFVPLLAKDLMWRWSDFWAFVCGGFGGLIAIAALLWSAGALDDFVDIQRFTVSYATDLREPYAVMQRTVVYALLENAIAFAATLLGAIMLFIALRHRTRGPLLMLVWLFAGGVSYMMQGKGFPYHALPFLVPLLAVGVFAWQPMWHALSGRGVFGRGVVVAVGLVLVLVSAAPFRTAAYLTGDDAQKAAAIFQPEMEWSDFSVSANAEAAAYLNAELGEDDTLFVWGYETLLYFHTRRPPAYRYPYSWPFLVSGDAQVYFDDLMSRLRADPPSVFVVENGDATGWVTGRDIDSRTALKELPALQTFLDDGYTKIGETPRFEYYRRTQ